MNMGDGNSSDDEVNGIKHSLPHIENKNTFKGRMANYPKPFDGKITEYTENTTIHGLKYLGEPRRPWAEKIFWILIFVICFVCLGYFVRDVLAKWKRCPVILVEDDIPTPIYSIPFPAVTICPQIKVKYEKFSFESLTTLSDLNEGNDLEGSFIKYLRKYEIAQQICHGLVTKQLANIPELPLKETIDASYIKLLYELSPNQSETIEQANYKTDFTFINDNQGDNDEESSGDVDNNGKVKHLFSTVLTNEGVCFTFNVPKEIIRNDSIQMAYAYNDINLMSSQWDSDSGYALKGSTWENLDFFPLFMFGAGKEFGLQIQLKSQVNDMNRLCQPTLVGFKIALHAPSIYPTTYEDYILVNYESITNIAVKPNVVKTSDNLRKYSPQRRRCYFGNERRLKYFAYYNKVNCKLECLSNFTMKNYECVHYALPMDRGTPICGAKSSSDGSYAHMYNYAENMESRANLAEEIDPNEKYDRVNDLQLDCDCLPECNSIEYLYDVETEPIDYFKINQKLQKILNSTEELDEVYTEINIFLKDTEVFGKTRNQLYTFSDLVSNFGGLMGLFMGASIISSVELIYFCIIRQICKSKGSCRRN